MRAEALQERVDGLEALNTDGNYKEGLALGQELLRQVEQVGHAPLQSRQGFQLAGLAPLAPIGLLVGAGCEPRLRG